MVYDQVGKKGRLNKEFWIKTETAVSYMYICMYLYIYIYIYILIIVRDATQSSLFIILQVHPTCFGCQPHPSSGVHKTVNTASGTGHVFVQLFPSSVALGP